MIFTADFETVNDINDCRIWTCGICNINNPDDFFHVEKIEDMLLYFLNHPCKKEIKVYFHNLKFDGEFIVSHLLMNGWKWVEEPQRMKEFSTLISDMGQWYNITLYRPGADALQIYDSLKILPFSVHDIAGSFGLEEKKGKIDYNAYRPVGHIPTDEEIEYLKNDCVIMAKALFRTFCDGDLRMTAGANALADYKRRVNKPTFQLWFPELAYDEDDFVRKSYKGGWTYCNPLYKNRDVGAGIVLDVNSLYPSRMKFCPMPYGTGRYYKGKYIQNGNFPLYVQHIECSFSIKKGYFPFIQFKNSPIYSPREFVESTEGEIEELFLTNVDLGLFLEHYDVQDLTYIDGYMYHAVEGMFDQYIDYWMERKKVAETSGDRAGRTLSKLKMNSLYGKFAKRPKGKSKIPYLKNGVLKFALTPEEDRGSLYIPVGTFITSYARYYTITSAQKCKDRFLYADTDSLHLLGKEIPDYLEVDSKELGKWKHEGTFTRARYLGSKCYIEEMESSLEEIEKYLEENPEMEKHVSRETLSILMVTCSGMNDACKTNVTWNNFHYNTTFRGKLKTVHAQGGVVLQDTTFEIKQRI